MFQLIFEQFMTFSNVLSNVILCCYFAKGPVQLLADVISVKAEDVQWNIASTFLSLHHQLVILFSRTIHSI